METPSAQLAPVERPAECWFSPSSAVLQLPDVVCRAQALLSFQQPAAAHMTPRSLLVRAFVAALVLAGPGPLLAQAEHAGHAAMTASGGSPAQQVAAAITALFAAAERNDMTALDSLYAGESLTIIEGAGINRGWTDYRDHHLAPEMKEMKNFQYRPTDIEAHVDGKTAWAIFRYTLKADVNGKPADIVGRGTAVLELRGSRWVVRHTQTSGRARRASDPA